MNSSIILIILFYYKYLRLKLYLYVFLYFGRPKANSIHLNSDIDYY